MRGMDPQSYTAEEVARRGEEIYEHSVRAEVEHGGANDGRFLALDVLSGDYEIADEALPVSIRLRERKPNAVLYLMRVGRPAAFRLGGSLAGRAPASPRPS